MSECRACQESTASVCESCASLTADDHTKGVVSFAAGIAYTPFRYTAIRRPNLEGREGRLLPRLRTDSNQRGPTRKQRRQRKKTARQARKKGRGRKGWKK